MTKKPRDSGILIRLAYQAMLKLDIDTNVVLSRLGLSKEDLYNSQLRTPHHAQKDFWEILEEVSGDPDIGLHLGDATMVYRGQILEYLFVSSQNFGDGLQRSTNYLRLISDVVSVSLGGDREERYFSVMFGDPQIRHLNEAIIIGLVRFFQFVTEDNFKPLQIEFNHTEHADLSEYQRIFNCPVSFGCKDMRIYFPAEILKYRSLHTEPELLKFHEQLANKHLANIERQDFIIEVTGQIANMLESGDVCVDLVAQRLGLSARSLRGQLAEAGCNFNSLLNDYRCKLSKRLLSRTNVSIHEIVYSTGFSEPSTFYRAFKRWENMTPIEYRQLHQNNTLGDTTQSEPE